MSTCVGVGGWERLVWVGCQGGGGLTGNAGCGGMVGWCWVRLHSTGSGQTRSTSSGQALWQVQDGSSVEGPRLRAAWATGRSSGRRRTPRAGRHGYNGGSIKGAAPVRAAGTIEVRSANSPSQRRGAHLRELDRAEQVPAPGEADDGRPGRARHTSNEASPMATAVDARPEWLPEGYEHSCRSRVNDNDRRHWTVTRGGSSALRPMSSGRASVRARRPSTLHGDELSSARWMSWLPA